MSTVRMCWTSYKVSAIMKHYALKSLASLFNSNEATALKHVENKSPVIFNTLVTKRPYPASYPNE